MTYQPLAIKTDDLTVGHLADLLDKSCSVGAVDDEPIGIDATDAMHNHVGALGIYVEIDQ